MSKPSQKKPDPKKQKPEEEPEEIDDGPHIFTTLSEQVKNNLIPPNKIEKANLIDYTIAIIHPNLITKHKTCKEIIQKITSNNLNIFNFLQKQLTQQEIENLYFKHTKANYFNDIVTHMSTGPSAILVLTNKEDFFFDENNIKTYYKSPIERWKDMIGDKDPAIAKSEDEESLRAIYGTNIINNGFWGSDNASDAYRELSIFYLPLPCTAPVYHFDENLITLDTIMKFLIPPKPDHTDLSGRLDMIGKYGPVCNHHVLDICICRNCRPNVKSILRKNGVLLKKNRDKVLTDEFIFNNKNVFCEECKNHFDNWSHIFGGIEGTHILTNEEIEFIMKDMNKNDLLEILIAEKGSSGKTILSKFDLNKPPNEIIYTKEHALKLISYLKTDYYDRYDFEELQNLINEDRRIRLNFWVSKMLHKPIESFPNPKLINFT
jgi:nucleoside diphosphate kinase